MNQTVLGFAICILHPPQTQFSMPRSKVTGQAVRSIIKSNARREHFLSKPAAPKKEQKPREKKTKDSKAVLKIKSLDVSEAVKTKKLKQLNHQVQNRSRRNAGTQYKGTQSLRLYTNASILGYRRYIALSRAAY